MVFFTFFYFLVAFASAKESSLSPLSPQIENVVDSTQEFEFAEIKVIKNFTENITENLLLEDEDESSDLRDFAEIKVIKNFTENIADEAELEEDDFDSEFADMQLVSEKFNESDVTEELNDGSDIAGSDIAEIKLIEDKDLEMEKQFAEADDDVEEDLSDVAVITPIPQEVNASDLIEEEMTKEEAEEYEAADITILDQEIEVKGDGTEDFDENEYAEITVEGNKSLVEDVEEEEYVDDKEFEHEDIQQMLAEVDTGL